MVTNMLNLTKAGLTAQLFEPKNGSYQINLYDMDKQQPATFQIEEVDLTEISDVNIVESVRNVEMDESEVVVGKEKTDDDCDTGPWGVMKAKNERS